MNNPTITKITPKSIYKSKLIVKANSNKETPSISIIKNAENNYTTFARVGHHSYYNSFPLCQSFRTNSTPSQVFNQSIYPYNNRNIQPLKKTLVLDLDETLIHSTQEMIPNHSPNYTLSISFDPCLPNQKIYVYIRPHMTQFLDRMAKKYDLMIFTASQPSYANSIIDLIDKDKLISKRFYRNNCRQSKTYLLKDLSIINRDLKGVIIIDNNPIAYSLHNDNGIPIETWICNKNDSELKKLMTLLEFLNNTNDVRNYIRLLVDKSYVDYSKLKLFCEMKKETPECWKEIKEKDLNKEQYDEETNAKKDEEIIADYNSILNNNTNSNSIQRTLIQLNKTRNESRFGASNHYIKIKAVLMSKVDSLPLVNHPLTTTNISIDHKAQFDQQKEHIELPIVKRCVPKLVPNKDLFYYKLRKYTDKGILLKGDNKCFKA